MEYIMKSGILYQIKDGKRAEPLARIKNSFRGARRDIQTPEGTELSRTDIRRLDHHSDGTTNQKYTLYSSDGSELMAAFPCYADGEDPAVVGWPVCRAPRVNRANICLGEETFCLAMLNSQNYLMTDRQDHTVLQIVHMGITGGWKIIAQRELKPEFLCSLFIFCRYLEQENEFITV